MARLSTGQAYGATNRATAARLLGGIPTDATSGVIAQGAITAPTLQPRATPVDTFQQVGAPTLGGPVKFFAPPGLPSPGQDLANLSKALGGFSSTLQGFSDSYFENRKQADKTASEEATALVGQASKFGPARNLATVAANLERAAALGTPGAAQLLQHVREKQNNSVGKYWLERSIEENAIQGAALSLADRLANTSIIKVDGKDVELSTLPSDDPRYLQHRGELLFGGVQMSPQGYTKNQGIIIQAQLQADQAQRKRYNANQSAALAGQISVNRRQAAEKYLLQRATGNVEASEDAATGAMQRDLDAIRILPLPEETKTKLTSDYLQNFAADVSSAAKLPAFSALGNNLDAVLRPVLTRLMTGPVEQRVKADGITANEALRLYNTLGGDSYVDQLVAKANQSLIQDNTRQGQMAGIQQQQDYDLRRAAAKQDGTLDDPAASKGYYQREKEAAALIPDYQVRNARMSAIEADEQDNNARVVKPVQDARALHYAQQLALTQNDEGRRNRLTAELQADLNANRISSKTAVSIQTSLSAQGSKEVRTYDKDINKRIDAMSKEWEAYIGSPASYGNSTVTGFESQALYKARDDARRRSQEVVYQAIKDEKDPVQALNQLWTNSNFGLRRREDVLGAQPPRYTDTTQLIQKNTGNWSRNTIAPQEANQLRSDAKIRPLMKPDAWDRDVTSFLDGNPSQNFRTLLKALTTGPGGQKPSEVILNQFRLMGIDVPDKERQKIQALDGQEISRAPAPRRTPPQQNGALAGVQIAGRVLSDLLVPPAQAGPASDIMSMFYASPTARPKPVAPKVTVTPQARVDGYMKRLAYIETRIRNIPNAEGSLGRGYFQAFPAFSSEAIAASGGIDPRDPDYNRSAKASAAWIRTYNKKAWAAIQAGRYDEADRLLRNTWPSLPGGDQAQKAEVQKIARKYLK